MPFDICRYWMVLVFCVLLVRSSGAVSIAPGSSASPSPESAESPAKPEPSPFKDDEPPAPVVTEHTLTVNGKAIRYQAIAGYLLLRAENPTVSERDHGEADDKDKNKPEPSGKNGKPNEIPKGAPKAWIFFVAYLAMDVDPASRPVTFLFNGGPGAASVWLHVGGFGPRRVQLSDRGEALPPPSRLVDNESTLLDQTDLVFIDPVSTGYSRPAAGEPAQQFYGYKEDISSIGDFIRLWTTHYARWASPKFMLGESYGTIRAAGLSNYLMDRYGMAINGIVLIGTVLNFQTIQFTVGNDVPYPLYLPSFAAAAWYHKRLSPEFQNMSLSELMRRVKYFARTDYANALFQGDRLPPEESKLVADQLATFTGLSSEDWLRVNLRETDDLFFTQLLRGDNRVLGRYDSRFAGLVPNPAAPNQFPDPSASAVDGPVTTAFYNYLRADLQFETDAVYERLANTMPWLFSKNQYLNVTADLRTAMARNRYLKVLVCGSYFDLATPFYGAETTIAGLNLDPSIRGNVRMAYYESGHMLYIDSAARAQFKKDFDEFLHGALNQKPVEDAGR
ncbi:MAG: peptidase S10 [Verrucomicrobia bacterium]|nr:peptidase S10 [Verrucomicrobiota bacterium]